MSEKFGLMALSHRLSSQYLDGEHYDELRRTRRLSPQIPKSEAARGC
ncbi:MAG: hypothetical protein ACLUN5_15175 [Oscillospiraceae bacterium]